MTRLDLLLPAFLETVLQESLVKVAAKRKPRKSAPVAEVKKHYRLMSKGEKPDWKKFEGGLEKNQKFRAAALTLAPDKKTKAYVSNVGNLFASSEEVAKVRSQRTGESYSIRKLPDGRLGCTCGDWRYKRSTGGGNCKHIEGLSEMKKVAIFDPLSRAIANASMVAYHNEVAKNKWQKGSTAAAQQKQVLGQERQRLSTR